MPKTPNRPPVLKEEQWVFDEEKDQPNSLLKWRRVVSLKGVSVLLELNILISEVQAILLSRQFK